MTTITDNEIASLYLVLPERYREFLSGNAQRLVEQGEPAERVTREIATAIRLYAIMAARQGRLGVQL